MYAVTSSHTLHSTTLEDQRFDTVTAAWHALSLDAFAGAGDWNLSDYAANAIADLLDSQTSAGSVTVSTGETFTVREVPSVHWHVGANMSGYLPESDVLCFSEWTDAAEQVANLAREYADAYDDETWESLQDDVRAGVYPFGADGEPILGDDEPSERATVDAHLTDDAPTEGQEWATVVTDPRGWGHTVWLELVPADDCDEDCDTY